MHTGCRLTLGMISTRRGCEEVSGLTRRAVRWRAAQFLIHRSRRVPFSRGRGVRLPGHVGRASFPVGLDRNSLRPICPGSGRGWAVSCLFWGPPGRDVSPKKRRTIPRIPVPPRPGSRPTLSIYWVPSHRQGMAPTATRRHGLAGEYWPESVMCQLTRGGEVEPRRHGALTAHVPRLGRHGCEGWPGGQPRVSQSRNDDSASTSCS